MSIITLLTDFGLEDTYVASMKGVILGISPQATLVDICHTVPPQDVREAAYLLGDAYRDFPPGTVHLAVVDPEVGSARRAIAFRAGGQSFVGPDNGLFSYVLADLSARPARQARGRQAFRKKLVRNPHPLSPSPLRRERGERFESGGTPPWPPAREGAGPFPGLYSHSFETGSEEELTPVVLPRGVRAVELTQERFWRHPVSRTFHGRDIFAPVAAHLSLGTPLARLGRRLTEVLAIPIPSPVVQPDGMVQGQVIHVDRFGNLVTNLRPADLPPEGEPTFTLTPALSLEGRGRRAGAVTIRGLSASYAEALSDLLAIVGGSGRIEIALRNGSAASRLGAGRGAVVVCGAE